MDVLVFFAHPDDETILIGGTLALLADVGVRVHYLSATRGEGGEVGEPPLCAPEDLGVLRAEELRCAVETLGAESLNFLDYVDPRIGPGEELFAFEADFFNLVKEVETHIFRTCADFVITHGSNGEYGHPAHLLVNQAARQAISTLGESAPALYSVSPSFADHPKPRLANRDDPAHLLVDIRTTLKKKIAAAFCHRSQNALFVRRTSRKEGRPVTVPEVIMAVEGLHRSDPPVNGPLTDPLAEVLKAMEFVKEQSRP
jgi:LmbE family N-acetylglucosaminyl deacetylase